jgi:hypothetical protein
VTLRGLGPRARTGSARGGCSGGASSSKSKAAQRRRSSGTTSIKHDGLACARKAVIGAADQYQHGS